VRWSARPGSIAALIVGLATATLGVAGCRPESRQRVLELLFEDIPADDAPTAEFVRSPRHPAPATPTPTAPPQEAVQLGAEARGPNAFATFDDVLRKLPKDAVGNPDWMRAVAEKVVVPRPGREASATEQDVLELDVELIPASNPAFRVTFSHQKHGQWLSCSNCHDSIFEMKSGDVLPPEQLHSNRYCGTCHGAVAFETKTGCPLCHLQNIPKDPNGRVDWNRAVNDKLILPSSGRDPKAQPQAELDLDVTMESSGQPAFKAIFAHSSHTKWLACDNCHPRVFPMQGKMEGVKPIDLHSRRYCGSCHGSVAFGITTSCRPCHPNYEQARHHEATLDLDVPVPASPASGGTTTFSHSTHRFLECANCHSKLYDSAPAATKLSISDIAGGKYCSTCHGKVAADLIGPCERCHTGLKDDQ
jgi:c(7)-type cytochrome triheme protein